MNTMRIATLAPGKFIGVFNIFETMGIFHDYIYKILINH
jgi:hypothetical protein